MSTNPDPRGAIIAQGNVMRINNALVEEVFCQNNSPTGYLVISYAERNPNRPTSFQRLRLNILRNTVLLNSFGKRMSLCNIKRGMSVNVAFSSRMTRSIPPQSNAFLVVVQRRRTQPQTETTIDRIVRVDLRNQFLYTGDPNDINGQIRFDISNAKITDRSGNPIPARALRPGQRVRITHANFQTASIPPQTTAFTVQLL